MRGQKFSSCSERPLSDMPRCAVGIAHNGPRLTSLNTSATNNPSAVKRYMLPWLPLMHQSGPASLFFGTTKSPSNRVVPMSSPGRSGAGDSCDACRPGQRLGYDQRASPLNTAPTDIGENGFGGVVKTVQPLSCHSA